MAIPKTDKKTTFLLAAVLLVLLGIMVYVINERYLKPRYMTPETQLQMEIEQIQTQSESDDVESIEKDLEETNLEDIDKELMDIEKELKQAY